MTSRPLTLTNGKPVRRHYSLVNVQPARPALGQWLVTQSGQTVNLALVTSYSAHPDDKGWRVGNSRYTFYRGSQADCHAIKQMIDTHLGVGGLLDLRQFSPDPD